MLFGRKPFIAEREENTPCPNLLPCQQDYCSCSVAKSCLTICDPWTAAHQASPSFTISQSLLTLMSIESVMPSNHLILWCPLLPLPSIFPSIRVFSRESALRIRWPKWWRITGEWLFLRGHRYWSISENRVEADFLRGRFIFWGGEISICNNISLSIEKEDAESLETLIPGEGKSLSLHHSHTLV